jgi:hypothetical protein
MNAIDDMSGFRSPLDRGKHDLEARRVAERDSASLHLLQIVIIIIIAGR